MNTSTKYVQPDPMRRLLETLMDRKGQPRHPWFLVSPRARGGRFDAHQRIQVEAGATSSILNR